MSFVEQLEGIKREKKRFLSSDSVSAVLRPFNSCSDMDSLRLGLSANERRSIFVNRNIIRRLRNFERKELISVSVFEVRR